LAGGGGAAGGAAIHSLEEGLHEDANLDVILPAGRAVLAGAPPEMQAGLRSYLQTTLSRIAQGTLEEDARVAWLRGPVGRELVELAGPLQEPTGAPTPAGDGQADLDEIDRGLMRLLTEGSTNAEMAAALALTDEPVAQRLARLLARLGAGTRAEATSLAFRGLAAPR